MYINSFFFCGVKIAFWALGVKKRQIMICFGRQAFFLTTRVVRQKHNTHSISILRNYFLLCLCSVTRRPRRTHAVDGQR